jgi:hypothetical protein
VGSKSIANFRIELLPQRTTHIAKFYFLRPIPIWIASRLERDHSAGKADIDPVGVGHLPKSELPP